MLLICVRQKLFGVVGAISRCSIPMLLLLGTMLVYKMCVCVWFGFSLRQITRVYFGRVIFLLLVFVYDEKIIFCFLVWWSSWVFDISNKQFFLSSLVRGWSVSMV